VGILAWETEHTGSFQRFSFQQEVHMAAKKKAKAKKATKKKSKAKKK
jgi:hypothetical protein